MFVTLILDKKMNKALIRRIQANPNVLTSTLCDNLEFDVTKSSFLGPNAYPILQNMHGVYK